MSPKPHTDVEAATELLAREEAKDSLLKFTEYTHPSWETGEHHATICEWLEKLERGDIRRLCINAPPRHSKTELASRRFPAWYLGRHPGRQIICASSAGTLAQDIGADVRDMVKEPEYQNVFPGTELRQDAKAAGRWRTTKGGIYYAAGVDGTIVGRGAHLAVIDDPHGGRNKAESQRERDIVGNWYYGDLIQRMMRPPSILLIQTRWHEDDLAGRILPPEQDWQRLDDSGRVFRAGKWHVLVLRAIENEGTDNEVPLWPGSGKPADEDETLAGYPLEYLHDLRETMMDNGRAREWSAQYQQHPVAEQGTYIQRAWFSERQDDPPDNARIYIASDFAVTEAAEGRDPDWTEHGVFALPAGGKLHPIDWWGGQATADVWVERLLDLIQKHKPLAWFGEAGVIWNAVTPMIDRMAKERRIWFRKEKIPSLKDKAVRGRAFQAWSSSGRVVFPQSVWAQRVIDQCVAFPGSSHDDAFDVMSLMCLAIDKAHPAIAQVISGAPKRRNDYATSEHSECTKSWRTPGR